MKIVSSFTASNGQILSVELTEDDFTNGELEGLNLAAKHKKMCQLADLFIIRRFRDTGVWPEGFADQIAANSIK